YAGHLPVEKLFHHAVPRVGRGAGAGYRRGGGGAGGGARGGCHESGAGVVAAVAARPARGTAEVEEIRCTPIRSPMRSACTRRRPRPASWPTARWICAESSPNNVVHSFTQHI